MSTKIQSSREETAKREVGITSIGVFEKWTLVTGFLLMILSVPLWNHLQALQKRSLPSCYRIVPAAWDTFTQNASSKSIQAINRNLMDNIKKYEKEIEEESFLTLTFLPQTQYFLTRFFHLGNEKVYLGHGDWLYYRPGIDYLVGAGFLNHNLRDKNRHNVDLKQDIVIQSDPLQIILEFKHQLESRDIQLVVMPTPVKPMIYPENFSNRFHSNDVALQNASFDHWIEALKKSGVFVFDATHSMLSEKNTSEQFLHTDSHWTPQAMENSAELLSRFIFENTPLPPLHDTSPRFAHKQRSITHRGDIVAMLKLPEDQKIYSPETVSIHPVVVNESPWKSDPTSDVLLLGDSFSNIYSHEGMGWGQFAGFPEQLSFYLKRPIDTMIRNDAGAFATRQMLSSELAQGNDRLKGKRVVIWEFAARELSIGYWKSIPMELHQNSESHFFVPKSGQSLTITAKIEDWSTIPTPGSVPYKDHIMAMHLTSVESDGKRVGDHALVYLWSMRDQKLTEVSHLSKGMTVHLKLHAWSDVEELYSSYNRSELNDLAMEEACWGEWIR